MIGGTDVQMQGKSQNAQQLIELVNQSPLLAAGVIPGSTRLDARSGLEIFEVNAEVVRRRVTTNGTGCGHRVIIGWQRCLLFADRGHPSLPVVFSLVHHAATWTTAARFQSLSTQLGSFEQVAAQRTHTNPCCRSLNSRESNENLFLEGGDFNEAAAEMSERLSQMINTQAEDTCQIVSRQPVRPRIQERFQKVTVNVRMRCGIEDLKKVLYMLETSVPMVLTEELTVIKPRARRRTNSPSAQAQTALDIRFNMSGYLGTGGGP